MKLILFFSLVLSFTPSANAIIEFNHSTQNNVQHISIETLKLNANKTLKKDKKKLNVFSKFALIFGGLAVLAYASSLLMTALYSSLWLLIFAFIFGLLALFALIFWLIDKKANPKK